MKAAVQRRAELSRALPESALMLSKITAVFIVIDAAHHPTDSTVATTALRLTDVTTSRRQVARLRTLEARSTLPLSEQRLEESGGVGTK